MWDDGRRLIKTHHMQYEYYIKYYGQEGDKKSKNRRKEVKLALFADDMILSKDSIKSTRKLLHLIDSYT